MSYRRFECFGGTIECYNNVKSQLFEECLNQHLQAICFSTRSSSFVRPSLGGHPHQWNLVCDACLSLVDSFTQELNAAVFPKNGSSKVATPTVREWRPGQEGQQLRLRKLPEKESLPPNEKKGGTKTEGIYGILRTLLQRISLERISSRVFSSSSSAKEVFAKRKVVMWAVTGKDFVTP